MILSKASVILEQNKLSLYGFIVFGDNDIK
jgi:hypothetical protein